MSMIIEACIPYGPFEITSDGEKFTNITGFKFEADTNTAVPLITLQYGDTYKTLDDEIEARKAMLHLTNDIQRLKIEIVSYHEIFVSLNGIKQNLVRKINLETNLYGENKLEITYSLL